MRTIIIYEDKDIIVAHKPAGLATQTGRPGQADMVSELKNHLAISGQGAPYLGVVHRLDQPVEGLLVFGRNKAAASKLTGQLQTGMLNKHYYAMVYVPGQQVSRDKSVATEDGVYPGSLCGNLSGQTTELVDYMYKDKDNHAVVVTGQQHLYPEAKKAVLCYEVLSRASASQSVEEEVQVTEVSAPGTEGRMNGGPVSVQMLDVCIETGRFHQIRAQLAHAGLPLLGDVKYGTEESMSYSREQGIRNVALCAYRIRFRHPVTGKEMDFRIEPGNPAFHLQL